MAYLVTTRTYEGTASERERKVFDGEPADAIGRRAVVTLDQAIEYAYELADDDLGIDALDTGDRITLPDGRTLEVESLVDPTMTDDELVAAFNAEQEL